MAQPGCACIHQVLGSCPTPAGFLRALGDFSGRNAIRDRKNAHTDRVTVLYGSLESKMKQKENQFRERRSCVATWYPAYLVSCFVSVVYSRERVVVLISCFAHPIVSTIS